MKRNFKRIFGISLTSILLVSILSGNVFAMENKTICFKTDSGSLITNSDIHLMCLDTGYDINVQTNENGIAVISNNNIEKIEDECFVAETYFNNCNYSITTELQDNMTLYKVDSTSLKGLDPDGWYTTSSKQIANTWLPLDKCPVMPGLSYKVSYKETVKNCTYTFSAANILSTSISKLAVGGFGNENYKNLSSNASERIFYTEGEFTCYQLKKKNRDTGETKTVYTVGTECLNWKQTLLVQGFKNDVDVNHCKKLPKKDEDYRDITYENKTTLTFTPTTVAKLFSSCGYSGVLSDITTNVDLKLGFTSSTSVTRRYKQYSHKWSYYLTQDKIKKSTETNI